MNHRLRSIHKRTLLTRHRKTKTTRQQALLNLYMTIVPSESQSAFDVLQKK